MLTLKPLAFDIMYQKHYYSLIKQNIKSRKIVLNTIYRSVYLHKFSLVSYNKMLIQQKSIRTMSLFLMAKEFLDIHKKLLYTTRTQAPKAYFLYL